MRKQYRYLAISLCVFFVAIGTAVVAQQPDVGLVVRDSAQAPRIAVPDMTGPPEAMGQITTFNTTLWNDLDSAGLLSMVSKSFYPRTTPRQPEELRAGRDNLPADPGDRGLYLAGWSEPPVTTRYLTFGALSVVNDRLMLSGYLYDSTSPELRSAHMFGKTYYATNDAAGARRLAHDFSRDVLERLGLGTGLAGTRIYYVSKRTGAKEIWAMDFDGSNDTQLTRYNNLSLTPTVSPDGTRLAFTSYAEGTPGIFLHSLETNRRLTFYNQAASLNATPSFTPDGTKIAYASSASGQSQIYMSDLDGRNFRRISYSRSLDIHPAVNPKTGAQIAFTSGRSGLPQIYLMDMDGANVRKMSPGGGDAVQPAWDPRGENIAFAWTRGFEPGNYNIFVINVATEELVQLTHGAGRNEHPTWSPSGTHIVFSSNRNGETQIYTMRADGTDVKKLTSRGMNEQPFWGVK